MSGNLFPSRVLVVEDEPLVAMLIEDLLVDQGCDVVGPAASLEQALALVAQRGFDAALLDINLGGREVFPVAEALEAAGIPFVFVTGGGWIDGESRWRGHPTILKPFRPATFWAEVVAALRQAAGEMNSA